ncbi:MAG: phosphonate ABC transporter ATP-binding protein [Halanaerobium sp.]
MGNNILEINNLTKTFPGGTEALKDVSLSVPEGEFLVLIGASGAGKSTLLRCINGLTPITSGDVNVIDKNVKNLKRKEIRKLRRKIGMIFQSFNIVKRKRVLDNVLHGKLGYYGLRGILGLFTEEDKREAFSILDRLGLAEQAVKRSDQLSGGQMQRVAIARAIMQKPKLILADEPVASLDPGSSDKVLGYLRRICKEDGITAIISLHQMEYARQYADRIVGLTEGEVTFEGTPADLDSAAIQDLYFEEEEDDQ